MDILKKNNYFEWFAEFQLRTSLINTDAATKLISPLGYVLVFSFQYVFFSSF